MAATPPGRKTDWHKWRPEMAPITVAALTVLAPLAAIAAVQASRLRTLQ